LPKELRHLTLEQSLGTKPFTRKEIKYLLDVRRMIMIMVENIGNSRAYILVSKTDRTVGVLVESETFFVTVFEENDGNKIVIDNQGSGEEWGKVALTNALDGRLDTKIIEETFIPVVDNPSTDNDYANLILLDLRSIFLILKYRFEAVNQEKADILARKYTQYVLDTVMNDMSGTDPEGPIMYGLYSLLQYLMCNALILDVNVNFQEYYGEHRLNDSKVNDMIVNQCNELYDILSNIISGMTSFYY